MSRYNPVQLKKMAEDFLKLDSKIYLRTDHILSIIQQRTGLSFNQIRENIRALAKQS